MPCHHPIVIALAGVFVTAASASADILDVPSVDYPTIQSAIDDAVNGDVIMIQPRDPELGFPFDAYYENLDMLGKEITLTSIDPSDPVVVAETVIDGSGGGATCIRADNVGVGGMLDGLTIRGGEELGGGNDRGGGLRCSDNAQILVRRCVFSDNEASHGGAVYVDDPNGSLAPTFEDCTFVGNYAVRTGTGNTGAGGAVYCNEPATFTRCVFDGNDGEWFGGAVFVSGSATFEDCTFKNNSTLDWGGALNISGSVTLIRCHVQDNHAEAVGGGVAFRSGTTVCDNCVIDGNESVGSGGGVAASGGSVTLRHVTIADNTGGNRGGLWVTGANATLRNTIIWGNVGGTVVETTSGSLTATYTNSQTPLSGDTNMSDAPLFVDMGAGDFSLLPGSPCIDRGDSNILVGATPVDFAGNNRALDDPDTVDAGVPVYHLTVDLGAFEFVPDGPIVTCEGDLNGDSIVDVADLLIILGAWGICP